MTLCDYDKQLAKYNKRREYNKKRNAARAAAEKQNPKDLYKGRKPFIIMNLKLNPKNI